MHHLDQMSASSLHPSEILHEPLSLPLSMREMHVDRGLGIRFPDGKWKNQPFKYEWDTYDKCWRKIKRQKGLRSAWNKYTDFNFSNQRGCPWEDGAAGRTEGSEWQMTRGPGEHFLRGTRKCSDLRRVCAYGLSGEEAATRKEGRRKVSPDLVDAQMGLGDLDFVQVKPLQGSKLKEGCALSPAFARVFEPCYRAGWMGTVLQRAVRSHQSLWGEMAQSSPGLGWRPWKGLVLKLQEWTSECPLPAQDSLSIYHNATSIKSQDVSLEKLCHYGDSVECIVYVTGEKPPGEQQRFV